MKLQFIRTDKECVLGWVSHVTQTYVVGNMHYSTTSQQVTTPFELYVALSPKLPKSAAVGAANALTRWVKKGEAELFLRDAPVF